jgi:SAM-dependent methyltransferase
VPHAHLHVLLGYADEPNAGRGLRWWLKRADNPPPRSARSGSGRLGAFSAPRPGPASGEYACSVRGPALPAAAQRADAQRLYGADPVGYELGRPDDPDRVYEVLVERCCVSAGTTVLEIGPGTGRATRRLAVIGARVVAVEPDPALAAYLRDTICGPATEVVEGTFETVPLDDEAFDVAVAAMSFHWVDQDIALPKLVRILKPGGAIALWWTLFGDPARPDPFHDATRGRLGERPDAPVDDRLPFELDTDGWRHQLTGRAGLVDFTAEHVRWTARLAGEPLRAFYGSLVAVRRRPRHEQSRVLDELVSIAESRFDGIVERPFVTAIYTARRPSAM